jgi:hypothetical protein
MCGLRVVLNRGRQCPVGFAFTTPRSRQYHSRQCHRYASASTGTSFHPLDVIIVAAMRTIAHNRHRLEPFRRTGNRRWRTQAAEHWRNIARSQERQIAQLKQTEEQAFAAGRAEGLKESTAEQVQGGLLTEEQEKEVTMRAPAVAACSCRCRCSVLPGLRAACAASGGEGRALDTLRHHTVAATGIARRRGRFRGLHRVAVGCFVSSSTGLHFALICFFFDSPGLVPCSCDVLCQQTGNRTARGRHAAEKRVPGATTGPALRGGVRPGARVLPGRRA